MKKVLVVSLFVCFISGVTFADIFGSGVSEFAIDFVTISGDTNPASGYGIVNNDYRMGTYEISNDQFAMFASNNPYYTDGGVSANNVSWFEAAQFVNFLNTSTDNQAAYNFDGSTFDVWEADDEGYDALNPFRNSNAKYFMPSEDEWVKAAYWNGTSLQTYASVGDVTPTQSGWNFYDVGYATDPYGPWDVGSSLEELNGTFDMMGNVWEWTESPYTSGQYSSGSSRGLRGGSFFLDDYHLGSSNRYSVNPDGESFDLGFRVASNVPEPCSLVLLGLGGLVLRNRRRVL